MVFKEPLFRGNVPETERQEATPPSTEAEVEAQAADTLAAVADLDATQVSVVFVDGTLVLSGFVGSAAEADRAAEALALVFPALPVENRLRVG